MQRTSSFGNTLSVFHCNHEPVMELPDSDPLGESAEFSAIVEEESQQVVPHLRQSVLIGSLIEQLCSLYEKDKAKSKRLYFTLCNQLRNLGIISPVAYLQEFTSVRTQYKRTLYNIIQTSILQLDVKTALPDKSLRPTLDENFVLNAGQSVFVEPEKVFDFDLSRYSQDFDEKEKLGTGGYGNVVRARSKIDGQDYAIKKIMLRLPQNDNYEVLLREVHVLATLKHSNIVRYHSAWIEYAQRDITKSFNRAYSKDDVFSSSDNISNGYHDLLPVRLTPDSKDCQWCESSDEKPSRNTLPIFAREDSRTPSDVYPDDVRSANADTWKKSPSKFWDSSVSGSTTPSKKMFTISPQSSDDENDDMLFESQERERGDFAEKAVRFKTPNGTPPQEVILTHGVKRDIDMRRVKSFIITKDSVVTGVGVDRTIHRFFNAETKRSHSLTAMATDYVSAGDKALFPLLKGGTAKFPKPDLPQSRLVLYIQMELCQTSLKRWLSFRNRSIFQGDGTFKEAVSLHIMKQIVSALDFIHSKGLIHRDVKPPNIFVNDMDKPHVLLGDFGLAKSDFTRSESLETPPAEGAASPGYLRRTDSHTSGVGTTTYAAPEQLKRMIYDSKVDMYSLGIVIFELWQPFCTGMERAEQMKRLRTGKVPMDFSRKYPELADLVKSLVSHDPVVRPSAEEILNSNFFEKSKDKVIEEQARRIELLEKENKELRVLLQRQCQTAEPDLLADDACLQFE